MNIKVSPENVLFSVETEAKAGLVLDHNSKTPHGRKMEGI